MNINELLLPISKENVCGTYLLYDDVYDQIKELRREDDAQLSQGIWQTEIKKANWSEVYKLCYELLKTKTKDLQIAIWLTESLIAEKGFIGLNEGLELIQKLCEKFWDNIFPNIDKQNNNYSYRLSPILFLADKLPERIVLIPLTNRDEPISYSLSDWMSARHNLQVKNYKGISLKNIGKQIAATPIEIFQETKKQIQISLQLLRNIRNFLDEKCNNESPSFRQLFDILEDIQRITEKNIEMKNKQGIRRINNPQILDTKTDEANKIIEESVINQENTKTSSESTPTIEQAYNALNEIAVFLEKKQPQSPASTLVKIAYEIGKKSFQELLKLNIDSGVSVLNTISELYKIFHQKNEEKNPLNEFPSINKMI